MAHDRVEQQTSAVLAGACFVIFTQLSTRVDLPGLLAAAWWLIAVSMPILASIALLPLVLFSLARFQDDVESHVAPG
jgi:hypothetical protein